MAEKKAGQMDSDKPDSNAQLLMDLSIEDLRLLARIPIENPNPILRVGFDGILTYANQSFFKLKCNPTDVLF